MPGIVVTDQPIRPDTRMDGQHPVPDDAQLHLGSITREFPLDSRRLIRGLTHVISLVSVQGVVSGERVRRRAKRMHLRLANWDSNLLKGQVLVPRLSAALR